MSEAWIDEKGEESIPDKETDNGVFGDMTLFPSNFGMGDVGDNSGDCSSNEHGKPNKIIIVNDEIGKNRIETIIEDGDADADEKISGGVFAGLDVFLLIGFR